MDSYKGNKETINYNIHTIYSKLSNPQVFKEQIDKNMDRLPEEAKEQISKLQFDADGIAIESPMGPVKLSVAESHEPDMVKFTAPASPVPFALVINLEAIDEEHTASQVELSLDLPMMFRAMVGSKLKDGAKKLGEVIAAMPYGNL